MSGGVTEIGGNNSTYSVKQENGKHRSTKKIGGKKGSAKGKVARRKNPQGSTRKEGGRSSHYRVATIAALMKECCGGGDLKGRTASSERGLGGKDLGQKEKGKN